MLNTGPNCDDFSLKFFYNGEFKDTNYNKVYYGGSFKFYDGIDADKICVSMFSNAAKKLTNRMDVRCYYRVPTLNLLTGLRAIRSDADIRGLIQWVPTFRVLEIYVETGVFEEVVPIYNNVCDDPSSDSSSSESEPSDYDEDELVEIEPPPVQVQNLEDHDNLQDDDVETVMRIEHEELVELLNVVERIEREEISKSKGKEPVET